MATEQTAPLAEYPEMLTVKELSEIFRVSPVHMQKVLKTLPACDLGVGKYKYMRVKKADIIKIYWPEYKESGTADLKPMPMPVKNKRGRPRKQTT
jgi:hypothetical protein